MKVGPGDGTSARRAFFCFRAHSGWATLVTMGGTVATPHVLQRRRLELCDGSIPGSVQPYHTAKEMALETLLDRAATFLRQCAEASATCGTAGLRAAIAELAAQGFTPAGACVLLGSGRPTPDLARTLAAHPLIHTAEGHFFREALRASCEACGMPIVLLKEKELQGQAAARLGLTTQALEQRILELGKTVGPPWRQDEKLCALAGWLTLLSA